MLEELDKRLAKTTAPDRDLDLAIHEATHSPLREGVRFGHVPKYTASLDAAVALVERRLPGWRWGISAHSIKDGVYEDGPYTGKPKHTDGFRAHITERSPLRPMPNVADAKTAPLAILTALLQAIGEQP